MQLTISLYTSSFTDGVNFSVPIKIKKNPIVIDSTVNTTFAIFVVGVTSNVHLCLFYDAQPPMSSGNTIIHSSMLKVLDEIFHFC